MAKEFKGFGKRPKKSKVIKKSRLAHTLESLTVVNESDINLDAKPSFDFEAQEQRLKMIVEKDGKVARVSRENFSIYQKYLEDNIELPCLVTGHEDFPWEEKYVFGYGSQKEYEELKKTNPSYTDTYELIEFKTRTEKSYNIHVKVRRVSDKKQFVLPLDDLEPVDKTHKNMELISDYSSWFANWQ